MWQAQYQTTTDVPAEKLYGAISDINTWSIEPLTRVAAPTL
jgi:hypothetical protein